MLHQNIAWSLYSRAVDNDCTLKIQRIPQLEHIPYRSQLRFEGLDLEANKKYISTFYDNIIAYIHST